VNGGDDWTVSDKNAEVPKTTTVRVMPSAGSETTCEGGRSVGGDVGVVPKAKGGGGGGRAGGAGGGRGDIGKKAKGEAGKVGAGSGPAGGAGKTTHKAIPAAKVAAAAVVAAVEVAAAAANLKRKRAAEVERERVVRERDRTEEEATESAAVAALAAAATTIEAAADAKAEVAMTTATESAISTAAALAPAAATAAVFGVGVGVNGGGGSSGGSSKKRSRSGRPTYSSNASAKPLEGVLAVASVPQHTTRRPLTEVEEPVATAPCNDGSGGGSCWRRATSGLTERAGGSDRDGNAANIQRGGGTGGASDATPLGAYTSAGVEYTIKVMAGRKAVEPEAGSLTSRTRPRAVQRTHD
jgi:hypothetical protein